MIASTRPSVPRRILGVAAATLGGVLVAVLMAGGTYAFLNAQASTAASTVTSGNLGVTVQYGSGAAGNTAALPTTAWTTMLPGDFAGQQVTVASSGTIGSIVTARLAAATGWDIRVATGACPSTQLTTIPLTTTAANVATLAAGGSMVLCVQATLASAASAATEGTTVPFTILLDATQVAP